MDIEEARVDPGAPDAAGSSGSDGSGGSESPSGGNGGTGGSAAGQPTSSDGGDDTNEAGSTGNRGSAGDNGGNADAGSGGSDDGPPPSLCETYCATIDQHCTGDFAQYSDLNTCLAVCRSFPEGAPGDSDVNTIHCRLAEAQKAAGGEPFFYCPKAGPGGDGACGEDCDGYCTLMMELCTAESTGGLYYFNNNGACKQACKDLPVDSASYSPSLHAAGPHFQCRLFHACSAIADPDYHCGHALGEPPCQIPAPE